MDLKEINMSILLSLLNCIMRNNTGAGASGYLVYGPEHLSCVGDSFHGPTEDVQRELQSLQDLTALTVQTQALQRLKAHTANTDVSPSVYWLTSDPVALRTSRVSLPLVSSSWTFSSARLRACSSACSLCFRVY